MLSYMQICVEGPTGIKLRECADKVIGLKQEMTVMKQNMKSQANTQDSLRAAVSHLDKQVQVLPSTLAKQLAQPVDPSEPLPKTQSQAAEQHLTQRPHLTDVSEKQMTQWSEALDEQAESESVLAARAAFLHQQQQQHVPLSRQLIEEPQKQAAAGAAPGPSSGQPATIPEPVVPQVTVVQVSQPLHNMYALALTATQPCCCK